MRFTAVLGLSLTIALASFTTGCKKECIPPDTESSGSGSSNGTSTGTDATQLVLEADVVQLDSTQNFLYAISNAGEMSAVDASKPGALTLLSQMPLSGTPFEMYQQGHTAIVMSNNGSTGLSALLTSIDLTNPAVGLPTLSSQLVAGQIFDSRIVGHILYLATYEDTGCSGCTSGTQRTVVTSYDITDPTAPKLVDTAGFLGPSTASQAYTSTSWQRSIFATDQRIYVGGLTLNATTTPTDPQGLVEVLDISDPNGKIAYGADLVVAGPILNRWQMDETDGIFRVVSELGAGVDSNGSADPELDTFQVDSSQNMPHVGHTSIALLTQEALKSVRFDGPRGYVVTAQNNDPIFTVDLTDPANPVQGSSLEMPGWIFHLEPEGNLLVGLGLDSSNPAGSLNVSLFDVTDIQNTKLLDRQPFGPIDMYSDLQLTTEVLAEDQDRIEKAFRIFDDGLIAIPYSGASGDSSTCTGGGVQLFTYSQTGFQKQALLPMNGSARRAVRLDAMNEMIGVSDSDVSAFDISSLLNASSTADVTIGSCVPRVLTPTNVGMLPGDEVGGYDDDGYTDQMCQ